MTSAALKEGAIWSAALDTLDLKLKATLAGIAKDPNRHIIESILWEAERKKILCLQKRWKVRFRGKTIVLRDLFDKIIAWVNQYKIIVDTAVQFDTTGASLPWAGIRFLLQVAVSDTECFESTVQGLESVSLLIARYAAFEALYLQKGSTIQAELKRSLTSLYGRILSFLANGIQYFNQSTARRLVKSVFQTSQNEDIDEITKLDGEVIKLAQIVDAQVQQQTLVQVDEIQEIVEMLQRPIRRLIDASAIYTKTLDEEKFRAVLNWLSSIPYTQHHQRHSEARLSGSAQWLLRHPQYEDWKGSSSSSLFLLQGIPGSGKTNLTSAIIDSFLEEHSLNPLSAPIAYFYCGDNGLGRSWTDPEEAMRSLTRQFAIIDKKKPKINEQIALEYARREAQAKLDGFEIPKLQASDCADLILNLLGTNPAVIVVDGVDEIEEHRRHELLGPLIRIRDESASVVKIFVSSRDNVNVITSLPDASVFRVQEIDTRNDMELFVEYCVTNAISTRSLLHGNVSDNLRHEIKKFLLDRAGEMFLWVQLQIERLCKLRSTNSVSEALNDSPSSPTTIDDLYSKILDDLIQKDPLAYSTAAKAFSWLLCMYEPLSTVAFLEAVSIEISANQKPSLSELLSICSNLIVVDKQLDTLRFAHASFKEFLEAKPEFDGPNVHCIATSNCLETCFQSLPIEVASDLHPENDLSLYSVLYWARHYAASAIAAGDRVVDILDDFVFGDDGFTFQLWLEAVNKASEALPDNHSLKTELNAVMSESQTPLFLACIYGLEGIFDRSIQDPDSNINARNLLDHTGLYLAASFGHADTVESLLGLGADPGISHGRYGDPLSAACAEGHQSVVAMLLAHKAYSCPQSIKPALRLSFLAGRENLTILMLKSYHLSLINSNQADQDNNDWLLEEAARAGFTEVMEELTKFTADDLKASRSPAKVVTAAIRRGHVPFVKKLIEKGPLPADVIATAALFGKTEIIDLCLERGYDLEKEGQFGTPLRVASLMGHENAVRKLLSRGANVNTVTPFGDALQAAAMKGHLLITGILIQRHADVGNSGGFFGTALQAASYRGHKDVVRALLDAGARIHQNGRYKDAFHAAAEAGKEEIVFLFIQEGYTLARGPYPLLGTVLRRSRQSRGQDLLRMASPSFSKPAYKYLEDSQKLLHDKTLPTLASDFVDILRSDGDSYVSCTEIPHDVYQPQFIRSPQEGTFYGLEVAASRGYLNVVELMLVAAEKLGVDEVLSGPALWAACRDGHIEVVKLICSMKMNPRSFRYSFWCAAKQGHLHIIEILVHYLKKWASSVKSNETAQTSLDPGGRRLEGTGFSVSALSTLQYQNDWLLTFYRMPILANLHSHLCWYQQALKVAIFLLCPTVFSLQAHQSWKAYAAFLWRNQVKQTARR